MRQWTIDAFAAGPFLGNPACVVEPFDVWPETAWMQALAAENNQAETAFLLSTADPARFGLRWFTPALEVPLCGHATLASGHALIAELGLEAASLTFDTLSGPLGLERTDGGYRMNFPARDPARIGTPPGLADLLGVEVLETWADYNVLAVVADEAAVRAAAPDPQALRALCAGASDGPGNLIVCACAAPKAAYDVVSRFFAPGSGVDEDAATGSAHCTLSPLFSGKLGRSALRFHQAYPGRGADLACEHRGDRVLITGAAVTVIESRLRL